MRAYLRSTALACLAGVAAFTAAPQQAQAQSYPIDCAILLCLSGGWPASAPCVAARAEFIRRVTPWPIEPPLQIWRCPMSAYYDDGADAPTLDRLWDVLLDQDPVPLQSIPMIDVAAIEPEPAVMRLNGGDADPLPPGFALRLAQGADIDISDPAFDFVRSIRVFDVSSASQRENNDGECNRRASIRVGTYGPQGDFSWSYADHARVLPAAHVGLEDYGRNCPLIISHRSVFVDWRDYEGNYGFEQVNY